MARKKRGVIRIVGWILGSFVSLVLLVTLVFYLGRGWILRRALDYVNENQPGEIQVGRINLIPFMGFPEAVLQLRNISFYEKKVSQDSLYQEPVLSLNEIYVSLDVVQLIRGTYSVSRTRFEDGFVRMEIYEDGISSIERALGISFHDENEKDTAAGMPDIRLDMEKLQVENVLIVYRDRTRDDHLDLKVNRLESMFRYLPGKMETEIKLDIDVKSLKYLNVNLEKERNIEFSSRVEYDTELNRVRLNSSSLRFAGLDLDAWGTFNPGEQPHMNMAFRARNSGLELLNLLFKGVLDLDEIEQIGDGQITLSGNINGVLGDELPVIRLNGQADRLGFRIKSLQRDVTGISFKFYATNGRKADLSEAVVHMEGFTAVFPEGYIKANITASNVVLPDVKIVLDGEVELDGLDTMLETDIISSLEGKVAFYGNVHGVIDKNNRDFLKDAGEVSATFQQVGLVLIRDTVIKPAGEMIVLRDTVKDLTGEVYLRENSIGTDLLNLEFNGSRLEMSATFDNLLLYLLDYDTEIHSEVRLSSDILYPGRVLRDTSIEELLGPALQDLRLHAGITVSGLELDRFLESDTLPGITLEIMDLGVKVPVYNEISDVKGKFRLGPDAMEWSEFTGKIGDSRFLFGGQLDNIQSLIGGDSTGWTGIRFDFSADRLMANDLFTYRDTFQLPREYLGEYLQDLRLSGDATAPGRGILNDPGSMDFCLNIEEMAFEVHFYPHPVRQFQLRARREGDRLVIDTLKGSVGESNLRLSADLLNFTDTVIGNWKGSLNIGSDLLDLNSLMDFSLPGTEPDSIGAMVDTMTSAPTTGLDRIVFPGITVGVDIGEIRYEGYKFFGLIGKLWTTGGKIMNLDRLTVSTESGGKISLSGQVNVADPELYTFSTEFDIDDINIRDLPAMESGDTLYRLDRNFRGLVSMDGLAEVFISPDFAFDLDNTTAVFNVKVVDGAMIDFSPLQVAAKYLDNRDLNNVRFATLQNSFPMTLSEGTINVPLTVIESTLGQMLIEGEQNLDNTFLYLLRLPRWLVWDAIKGRLTPWEGEEVNDQIYEYESGKFLILTVLSDGTVRLGDKRDKYRNQE